MSKTSNSKIFGIIGKSLTHSLSPQIHNHFFKKLGLDYSYHLFTLKDGKLQKALEGIKTLGIKGVNVTFPYKEKVIPFLDKLDKQAEKTGAVNTIINNNGKLFGYNTDVFGIQETIEQKLKLDLNKKRVMILGAGGAARAVFYVLLTQKVRKVFVFNRTKEKARRLVKSFSGLSANTEAEVKDIMEMDRFDPEVELTLLVNATSAPVPLVRKVLQNLFHKEFFSHTKIFDLNYGEKRLRGDSFADRYTDGLYMLASQAAQSFYLWTKIKLDPKEVYNYIRKKTEKR